jgi:hypothetical protein
MGRFFLPSFAAVLGLAQVAMIFFQAPAFLSDPGTGWQLKAGALLVEGGALLRNDPFLETPPERPWIMYQWLWQAAFGKLEGWGGLPLVCWTGFLVYACVPMILLRMLYEAEVALWPALLYTGMTLAAYQAHVLARPHMMTYVFFAALVAFWARRQAQPRWWEWVVGPAVFAVWANSHGAFVAGLLFLAVALAGETLDRRAVNFRWWAWAAVCAAATLANPYGWALHEKIVETLFGLQSVRWLGEHQSLRFGDGSFHSFWMLILVLGLVVLVGRRERRWTWAEALPLAVFLLFALRSQRNVFLFFLVAAVPFCRGWQELLSAHWAREWWDRGRRLAAEQRKLCSAPIWLLGGAAMFWAAWAGSSDARALRVGKTNLSAEGVAYLQAKPGGLGRVFSNSQNGGTLVYYLFPGVRVSLDDRIDVYGDQWAARNLRALDLRPGWKETLAGYDTAVLNPGDRLAQGLLREARWRRGFADATAVIFERIP